MPWTPPSAGLQYYCEFELQLRYYIHFRTNTHEKSFKKNLMSPDISLNSTTTVLLHDDWYVIKKTKNLTDCKMVIIKKQRI